MKTVCEPNQCAGCMACLDLCPANAIRVQDSIGSYNAYIDSSRCCGCNYCRSICPVLTPPDFTAPSLWKQGWASDPSIRAAASSGGIASAIEMAFIEQGGIVCSCFFQNGTFRFGTADKPEDVRQFTGSKYVKSNPEGIYAKIRQFLNHGRKVLFVGLPCQAAAVRTVFRCHKQLYTIDLICHGTPSPKLLHLYLHDRGFSPEEIRHISFRKKHRFQLAADGKAVAADGVWDAYTMAFCDGVSYTESCYSCRYAQLNRISDLTLGDAWGSELPMAEQQAGISLILCQNRKGEELLAMAKLHLEEVSLTKAVSCNHQLQHASLRPKKRSAFLDALEQSGSFQKSAWMCFPIKLLKKAIKAFFLKLKQFPGKDRYGT